MKGYAYLSETWKDGDIIELVLDMPVEKMQAHPFVRHDTGRMALMRGPIVYCLEEEDNGKHLNALFVSQDSDFAAHYDPNLLGGCAYLTGPAFRMLEDEFAGMLYKPYDPDYDMVEIKAIPYAMWSNRTPGDMLVWLNAK